MKKIIFTIAAFLLFVPMAFGQSADDIIAMHINALGGREKLLSLKTVRMTSVILAQGNSFTGTAIESQLVGVRSETNIPNGVIVKVMTPTASWSRNPMTSGNFEPMEAEDLKKVVHLLDIQSPLLDAKAKGTKVELVGADDLDGRKQFKLKLTFSNGVVSFYFLDANSLLLSKSIEQRSLRGTPYEVEVLYSDYKKNADGFMFPYSTTVKMESQVLQETRISEIQTNIPVDASVFTAK